MCRVLHIVRANAFVRKCAGGWVVWTCVVCAGCCISCLFSPLGAPYRSKSILRTGLSV